VLLYGPASSPAVKTLQVSLAQLAAATGSARFDPGPADGLIGPKTRSAVTQAVAFIAPRVPDKGGALKLTLQALSVASVALPEQFDALITKGGEQLAVGINLIIATLPRADSTPERPWWQQRSAQYGLLTVAGILTTILVMKRVRTGRRALPAAVAA